MRRDEKVPLICRLLVGLASYLAPVNVRPAWREHWRGELSACWGFLRERPELNLSPTSELVRYSLTAFPSAWEARANAQGPAWKRFTSGPWMPFFVGGMVLLAAGVVSSGFASLRTLFIDPPYKHHQQLVTLWQDFGALGRRMGVPAPTLREWQARSTLLSGFAGYYKRHVPLSVLRSEWVEEVRVSADLFTVLGVKAALGRGFEPLDAYSGTLQVVLSDRLWRSLFNGDPGILGQRVTVNGHPATIIGVMPRGFWFPSQGVGLWTVIPLEPEPPKPAPYLLSGIARLKPGVEIAAARAELRRIASKVHVHWNGSMVELSGLREAPLETVTLFLWAIPLAIAASVIAGRWHIGRKPPRFWLYLAGKVGFAYTVMTILWLEFSSPFSIGLSGWANPARAWLLSWWFLTASILLVWWALRDQKRRCPVCLCRLQMPVTIGSYSSPMLDPVSTELVCPRGHGMLYEPGGLSSEPGEWRAFDSSWRDFFSAGRK